MYKPTIGLEIHAQLKSASKMFCSCMNDSYAEEPNIHVCPVCLGHPGTLPTANKEAIKKVYRAGLALNCSLAQVSKFDRKNYFYPDLPKGYQISQYDQPLCFDGSLNGIRIKRIHLEEDTGRLIHEKDHSLVDFNRSGVPLMELVTEPDMHSGKEARDIAEELRSIFRYLEVSDANMERGQMRVEVNISLSKEEKLGTKVEIKNLNSFQSVERAVDYEIKRQTELLEKGEPIAQETRGWSEEKQETFSQREKEEAHDYRYFPEPDVPPFHLKEFGDITVGVELPQAKRDRFKEEYYLGEKEIEIFISDRDLANYFENCMSEALNWVKESDKKREVKEKEKKDLSKTVSSYIISDLLGLLENGSVKDILITPENFAELMVLLHRKEVPSKVAKQVLKEMFTSGADPSHIIDEKGLSQMDDEGEIESAVKEVIENNGKAVDDYKKGKEGAIQFLIGQVMAKTKGRAVPDKVKSIIEKLIERR